MEPMNQNRPVNSGMHDMKRDEGGGKKTLWIIAGVVAVIAIIGVIYGATQKTLKNTNVGDNVPVNQNGDVLGAAANRTPSPVTYTGFDVVNLQTFPYRVQVRVRGTVPEGCATADVPTATLAGKVFTVTMTGSKPADAVCTQAVTNVENIVELPASDLAAGTYSVRIGTMAAKTFTLSANNTIQYSGDK